MVSLCGDPPAMLGRTKRPSHLQELSRHGGPDRSTDIVGTVQGHAGHAGLNMSNWSFWKMFFLVNVGADVLSFLERVAILTCPEWRCDSALLQYDQ